MTAGGRTGPAGRGRAGGVSARVRIIGWMLGVLALAVTTVVFLSWQVLSARADATADAELTHEATKFRAFAGSPTAAAISTPEELLDTWLQNNLPDTAEAFFTTVDGRPYHRSQGTPPARLDLDPGFVQRAAGTTTPQYGWVDSTAGRVRYAVLPVQVTGQPVRAQLVLLEFRDLQAQPLEDAATALALIAAATLAMAAGACWLVAGRVLAPIREVRATAAQISESDLRRRIEVAGNDDVAQLARTFNTMLDRLENAFTAQREFVDNAGHELRTPITVIRGHLELMGDDPRDRAETRALVLDELARMNRMVDDLLVLAKSGRPDFLTLEEVNLTELVVEVLAKARPLGPRTWRVGESADVTVLADGQRLTQALMQLVANAVRHTAPGDHITLGSRLLAVNPPDPAEAAGQPAAGPRADRLPAEGDVAGRTGGALRPTPRSTDLSRTADQPWNSNQGEASGWPGAEAGATGTAQVLLWVADSGPGVSAADRERIFDRFTRGNDQGRTDGAGLGLAIVRSIARAHGGDIHLADGPERGARFELLLPLPLLPPDPDPGEQLPAWPDQPQLEEARQTGAGQGQGPGSGVPRPGRPGARQQEAGQQGLGQQGSGADEREGTG